MSSRVSPSDPQLVAERVERLSSDVLVTRRGYLKILGVVAGGLALGNLAVAMGAFRRRTRDAGQEVLVTTEADRIPIGGVVHFTYPGPHDPAVLLRLDEHTFVAYQSVCTHLACEVLWRSEKKDLYCPCHHGRFNPESGKPVAGPPKRALPRIALARRGSTILAVGEGDIGEKESSR